MRYFLKKSNTRKKGEYLQIYYSFYDSDKGSRNKSYKSIGYVSDLIASGIEDPYAFAKKQVDELNASESYSKDIQIGNYSLIKNAGHFLLKNMFDYLDVDEMFNALCINKQFQFKPSDLIRDLSYCQVISPGSKLKAAEKVIPSLINHNDFSYDQILDGLNYIGESYEKFIELLNVTIEKRFGKRKTSTTFFDCTNYYFEIDTCFEDKQKGPSKENKKGPIIGQALLLDEEQIPLAMKMYPGNESEKPYIRETIADIKQRYDIDGKIVQIADKGLNCAKNIYVAVKESNDGYIFSKTFRGKGISKKEKEWMLLENDKNIWTSYHDNDGNLLYRLKYTDDVFNYSFDEKDENGNSIKTIEFKVKERRVVTYNPSLARKQRHEINREVEKLKNRITVKGILKEELGDGAKYCNAHAFDKNGEIVNIETVIDQNKIDEALKFAGYNLLVTSETNKTPLEIYNAYHGLWRIEESFRIMKTYLEARPVFLQLKETIYGHFLICYIAFTLTRLIELKLFKDEIPPSQLFEFARDFKVTKCRDESYINGASSTSTIKEIQKRLGLRKLTNAYLTKKDVDDFFSLHLEDYFDL